MPVRADNDPKYSRRFLIMGILAIGFALWSVYDGAVRYPRERQLGYEDFQADSSDFKQHFSNTPAPETVVEFENSAPDNVLHEWQHYIHERGIHSSADVIVQFAQAAVAAAIGLALISIPLRARGRWIESTDTGINSSWGQSLNFDQVVTVDKRKWRDKGIAKVTYLDGNRRRKFVIDDYKFDRYPTDTVLYELEQKIDPEKIINGPPEPPPEARDSESAEEPRQTGDLI